MAKTNVFSDFINKTKKTAKSDVPEVEASDVEKALLEDIGRLANTLDTINTQLTLKKDQLKPMAQGHRLRFCHRDGKIYASVRYMVDGKPSLRFEQQDSYCKIEDEQIGAIQSIVHEKFDEWFRQTTDIEIKCGDMSDAEKIAVVKALAKVFGDRINTFCVTNVNYKPTQTYTHDGIFDEDSKPIVAKLEKEGLVKPKAPAFKAK